MAERSVEDRLGTLERRVTSMDQRLERVEGKQEAMLAWQQAHSERLDVAIDLLRSLNGHRS